MTYVKLPALDMLASLFARNDNDKLGDLAPIHPLLQLTHDLLDVRLDLVVGGYEHVEAIFFDTIEVNIGLVAL